MSVINALPLVVFVAVVTLDVLGLVIDAALWIGGEPLISPWLRAHPWAAQAVVAVNALAVVSLALHLGTTDR